VKLYLLNEQKRMMVLTFRDHDEVRELARELLRMVPEEPASAAVP